MRYYLATLTLLATIPASVQAQNVSGLWLTSDKESVVSIGACKKNKKKICGYLVRFPETGNSKLNRKLCGAKLIGEMERAGKRLSGGWIFSPEDNQAYQLIIYPNATPGKIRLRAYGKKVSNGENFTWTKYNKGLDKRMKFSWAKCAY